MHLLKNLIYVLIFSTLALSKQTFAQTPTWSSNVATIIYNNCSTCHHDQGIAPFSLLSYEHATAYAQIIGQSISENKMPPYPPDVTYQQYAHQRTLSQEEKNIIQQWIQNGTPLGDPNAQPEPPTFANNIHLNAVPNATYQIPTYTSTASTEDIYQCFVIPSETWTQHHITALEVVPGNPEIVHHVLVFQDSTGTCRNLDNNTPEIGYINFGGVGTPHAKLIGSWVPGASPYILPNNMGVPLAANADLVLQIHYPAGTAGLKDSTKVNLFWTNNQTQTRTVNIERVLSHTNSTLQNPPLFIPANTTKTFYEQFTLPNNFDVSLLAISPHLHLLGQKVKVFAILPNSTDTIPLINIPNWDFHWQGAYTFKNPVKLLGGSTLYAEAHYDNTTNNPHNPSSPPKDVAAGEATSDEMMLVYFFFAKYESGDDTINLEHSNVVSAIPNHSPNSPFLCYPSPASQQIHVICPNCPTDTIPNLRLFDLNGQLIYQKQNVIVPLSLPCNQLPAGIYFLQMSNDKLTFTHKLLIQDY